jgi:hypothetical protein
MEQEDEGKKSQAWRRGPSVHRVSILKGPLSMYSNVIRLSMMLRLMLYLFQENKSYGVKTICSHPLMLGHRTSPCRVWHRADSLLYFIVSQNL